MHRVGYEASLEQRATDRLFVAATALPEYATRLAMCGIAETKGQSEIYEQVRVGQNGELFTVYKLRTQDGDSEQAFNSTAALFRKTGFDELCQRANITEGKMSMFGWRPITPEEYVDFLRFLPANLREQWQTIVLPTKPGVLSTYGVQHHLHKAEGQEKAILKARMDIQDVQNGSLLYRARILGSLVVGAINGRLREI